MTDIKHIITLAEAATPGPWTSRGRYIGVPNHMSFIGEIRDKNGNWSDETPSTANAAFIAAANPATVKAMAERLMRLEEALHLISLASQNNTETRESMGKVAREALENKP